MTSYDDNNDEYECYTCGNYQDDCQCEPDECDGCGQDKTACFCSYDTLCEECGNESLQCSCFLKDCHDELCYGCTDCDCDDKIYKSYNQKFRNCRCDEYVDEEDDNHDALFSQIVLLSLRE